MNFPSLHRSRSTSNNFLAVNWASFYLHNDFHFSSDDADAFSSAQRHKIVRFHLIGSPLKLKKAQFMFTVTRERQTKWRWIVSHHNSSCRCCFLLNRLMSMSRHVETPLLLWPYLHKTKTKHKRAGRNERKPLSDRWKIEVKGNSQ